MKFQKRAKSTHPTVQAGANNYLRYHQRNCSLQPLMLMLQVELGNEVALFHIWFFHTTPAAPPSHMYREGRLASQGWLEGVERVCGWGGGARQKSEHHL